jgi:pilus assembly protein CpaB
MNPRQRRAILLLALSALGLLAVFVLVAGYVSSIRDQVDPKVTVLELTRDVSAHTGVEGDMVKAVSLPRRWAPPNALTDASQLINVVTTSNLQANTVLQRGMLVAPPRLAPDQEEMAINIDASTGVAGRLQPDDVVDIVAAYAGANNGPDVTEVVVPSARVLHIGQPTVKGGQVPVGEVNAVTKADPEQVVPITFALTPRQVLLVDHAESFAQEVRLALLRPGDEQRRLTPSEKSYSRLP